MSNFNENKNFNKRFIALFFLKYFKLITIIITLFLFVLSFLLVIRPKYSKMKNSSDVLINAKLGELASMESYLDRLREFNKSYKNVSEKKMENINEIIPSGNNYEELIVQINDIVENRGLTLSSITIKNEASAAPVATRVKTPSPATKMAETNFPEKVKKVEMSLEVEGTDYQSMKNLVSDFETSLRLFDVESINFSDKSNSINLVVIAYYFES